MGPVILALIEQNVFVIDDDTKVQFNIFCEVSFLGDSVLL